MGHLVNLWVEQEFFSWGEAHGAMRAVIELTSILDKSKRENDPAFRKYRSKLAAWRTSFLENYVWENVSDIDAFGCPAIMNLNSIMLLDPTFDDSPFSTLLYYKRKMSDRKIPLPALSLLLELKNRMVCRQEIDMNLIGVVRETALKEMRAALRNGMSTGFCCRF